jgi:hypothetical protein
MRIYNEDVRFWLLFAICFIVPNALNPWALMPDYSGMSVSGFPLLFFQQELGVGYSYFNLIFFLLDAVIWFLVAKALVFGYRQFTKYGVLK